MDGIVLINKPVGITSYDIIRKAKKIFNTNKIGHTGTLDPFASGLVVICIGKATKLVTSLILSDKTYEGVIRFNEHYDTYDITGKLEKSDDVLVTINDLNHLKAKFITKYLQYPPIYSAIKVSGMKLYDYARKGISVDIEPRLVEIYDLDFSETKEKKEFYFKTSVSKGTYIRSLAIDIAESLNTLAVLTKLNRIKLGSYSLDSAVSLDELSTSNLISIEKLYENSPKVVLNDYMINLVKNGIRLDSRQIETNSEFRVYNLALELVAIYEPVGLFEYKPLIIL